MHEAKKWHLDQKIKRTLAELEKNGFQTFFAATRSEALEKVLSLIPPTAKVGIGGSVTIRELNLIDALTARGNIVIQHWQLQPGEDALTNMRKEPTSEYYLASSNAVTENGELINIDGTGNRVTAMIFGPQKVILVVGINKIVGDVAEGLQRAKSVAAPMNAKRLGRKTPCAATGVCTDCDAPDRICRVTSIMEKRPDRTEIMVMLVGEEMGF